MMVGNGHTDKSEDADVILRMRDVLHHLNRIIVVSEKNQKQDSLLSSKQGSDRNIQSFPELQRDTFITQFQTKLLDQDLPNERLQTVLKLYQYHLLEGKYLEEIAELNNVDRENPTHVPERAGADENHVERDRLPPIGTCSDLTVKKETRLAFTEPLRPTELLDRILKIHKMRHDIVIPTSTQIAPTPNISIDDAGNRRRSDGNSENKRNPTISHFGYAHGHCAGRNLPTQPEFIRLLTDPEIDLNNSSKEDNIDQTHSRKHLGKQLPLYGGEMSPPLIEKRKQTRSRRRRIVCKVCRQLPGDHLKWCVHYNFGNEGDSNQFDMVRSNTEEDISPKKSIKNERVPSITRSNTNIEQRPVRTDLPNYASLHRDVYTRALADARARIFMKRAHDFMSHSTRPWVFSYFPKLRNAKREDETIDGMERIFGKNRTDFTDYYSMFVSGTKIKTKQKE